MSDDGVDERAVIPRAIFVEWDKVTLSEIMAYKMRKGREKYGDPKQMSFTKLLTIYLRRFGEFLSSLENETPDNSMEALADINNTSGLLYEKFREIYIIMKNTPNKGEEYFQVREHQHGDQESLRQE